MVGKIETVGVWGSRQALDEGAMGCKVELHGLALGFRGADGFD